jgi:hypothetical protein
MKSHGPQLSFLLLMLAAAITLACGSSHTRMLQSVTISPTTADAQDYPNGQVPFTATAIYNTSPNQVTPFDAIWGACFQDGVTTAVSVSTTGVAQCAASASGNYTIWAFGVNKGDAVCNVVNACGGGCGRVTGTAQLTCP